MGRSDKVGALTLPLSVVPSNQRQCMSSPPLWRADLPDQDCTLDRPKLKPWFLIAQQQQQQPNIMVRPSYKLLLNFTTLPVWLPDTEQGTLFMLERYIDFSISVSIVKNDCLVRWCDKILSSLWRRGQIPPPTLPPPHILVGYDTYSAFRGQLRRGRERLPSDLAPAHGGVI